MFQKMKINLKKNKKGFSLIELMTVISIIGLLSVIFIPRLDFTRDRADMLGVLTDFRSAEMAVKSHNIATGTLPDATTLSRDLQEFGLNPDGSDFTGAGTTADPLVASTTVEGGKTYTITIDNDVNTITFTATHITPNPTLTITLNGRSVDVTTSNTGTARD